MEESKLIENKDRCGYIPDYFFMLRSAIQLLPLALYLVDGQKSGIDPLISLSARK